MAERDGAGRKSVLMDKRKLDAIREVALKSVESGMSIVRAFQTAGVSERTCMRWMKRYAEIDAELDAAGKESPDESFAEIDRIIWQLCSALKKTEVTAVRSALETIQAASKRKWQAAAWMLERRFPAEYGRRMELSGNPDRPLEVAVTTDRAKMREMLEQMTPEQRQALDALRIAMKG